MVRLMGLGKFFPGSVILAGRRGRWQDLGLLTQFAPSPRERGIQIAFSYGRSQQAQELSR